MEKLIFLVAFETFVNQIYEIGHHIEKIRENTGLTDILPHSIA